MVERATAEMAGCWLAGSSNRTVDELNFDTIMIAKDRGFTVSNKDNDILDIFEDQPADPFSGTKWADDVDISQGLSEIADDAVEWLNENVSPDGYHFEFDDGLYLYLDDESE